MIKKWFFFLFQLTFDTFTVGRFQSFTSEGCPDGYMSIREEGRPATDGQWCGSAWGYTVYYSETHSINLTLFLSRLSEQVRFYEKREKKKLYLQKFSKITIFFSLFKNTSSTYS